MLKEQIATMAAKALVRLGAIIIVASIIVGNSIVTSFSALSADKDVNQSLLGATKSDSSTTDDALANNVEQTKKLRYISSTSHKASDGIELVDTAANNTVSLSSDSLHPTTLASPLLQEETIENDGFVYVPEIPLSDELQRYTYDTCKEKGIDYSVVLALMWRESRFTSNSIGYNTNGTRDSGLMQINDVNKGWLYKELGISNLLDPKQNIDAGTEMLGRMTTKHGMHNALLAYQYGEQGMLSMLARGVTTNKQVQLLYSKSSELNALIETYKSA